MRRVYLILGHLFLVIGAIGVAVPLVPTVPFLLLAVHFYAIGSQRMFRYLINHPRWGPGIRDWREAGVIRTRAKVIAISVLSLNLTVPLVIIDLPVTIRIVIAATGFMVALFIATRPGSRSQSQD